METHPGWVPDDDVEPARAGGIGKPARKGERERSTRGDCHSLSPERPHGTTQVPQRLCLTCDRAPPGAEKVASTSCGQQGTALTAQGGDASVEPADQVRALEPVELPSERSLPRARGAGVSIPQSTRSTATTRCVREIPTREGITAPDVVVQVRKRRYLSAASRMVDHQREPEAEFAQPHRRGVDVNAEDRPSDHITQYLRSRARVARSPVQSGEPVERVHEEGASAACRIEQANVT
jgi:hypothetical protein